MSFSEIELKRIDRLVGDFCRRRSPDHMRDELRLEYRIHGHAVEIYEWRQRYGEETGFFDSPVAKIKFVRTKNEWRLYWQRADLKWHSYEMLPSSRDLAELVNEIDDDPFGCFFG